MIKFIKDTFQKKPPYYNTIKQDHVDTPIDILFNKAVFKISTIQREISNNKKELLKHKKDNMELIQCLYDQEKQLIMMMKHINKLKYDIDELSYSLVNKNSKLSTDTYNKMENFRQHKIKELEMLVDSKIEDNTIFNDIYNNDDSFMLASTQTDRRRFVACSMSLSYFKDEHPIKKVFLDIIKFQGIVNHSAYPFSEILENLRVNLCLIDPMKIELDTNCHIKINIEEINMVINNFIYTENVYDAFRNLQISIYKLTNVVEPGIDDTIQIYHQIAVIGINNPHFVFKLLTTCDGLDNKEQDKFINISYMKTTLLALMNDI